jgi:hypothetical protein
MAKADVDAKEVARRQHEHAKSMEKLRGQTDPLAAGLHVNTMLTTEEHVGKIPGEPHKPKEMVALGADVQERTGVDKVKTVPRKTPGKGTTDEVVVDPPTHAALGHTDQAPTEAEKVADAARGHVKLPGGNPGQKAQPKRQRPSRAKSKSK